MNKFIIVSVLLVFPAITMAWKAPVLESLCDNYINIKLATENNYIIEFSGTYNFDTVTTIDFIHSGSHAMHMPINGTLYARFASDHSAKTSATVKDCTPPKEEKKKKSGRRKHKHGYIRRPSVFANPIPVILPLFDYPASLPNVKG